MRRHHIRRARRPADSRGQREELLQQLGPRIREHIHYHHNAHRRLCQHERAHERRRPPAEAVLVGFMAGLRAYASGRSVAANIKSVEMKR